MGNDFIYSSGADPRFLDGGLIYKGGFDLLILPDYLLIFPDFLKILHENEIFSQRGVWANHLNLLKICHCSYCLNRLK